ncbi:hypothetical protein DFJ77DRAFT_495624 [Powellomyces hirtus]|nr:hypothetical protein DFJ77DRAFT_495624 [Powellomyces hirtus]
MLNSSMDVAGGPASAPARTTKVRNKTRQFTAKKNKPTAVQPETRVATSAESTSINITSNGVSNSDTSPPIGGKSKRRNRATSGSRILPSASHLVHEPATERQSGIGKAHNSNWRVGKLVNASELVVSESSEEVYEFEDLVKNVDWRVRPAQGSARKGPKDQKTKLAMFEREEDITASPASGIHGIPSVSRLNMGASSDIYRNGIDRHVTGANNARQKEPLLADRGLGLAATSERSPVVGKGPKISQRRFSQSTLDAAADGLQSRTARNGDSSFYGKSAERKKSHTNIANEPEGVYMQFNGRRNHEDSDGHSLNKSKSSPHLGRKKKDFDRTPETKSPHSMRAAVRTRAKFENPGDITCEGEPVKRSEVDNWRSNPRNVGKIETPPKSGRGFKETDPASRYGGSPVSARPNGRDFVAYQNNSGGSPAGRRLWTDVTNTSSSRDYQRTPYYEEYYSLAKVNQGIKDGAFFKGSLRINKRNRFDAYVTLVDQEDDNDIYLCGVKSRNRALEGDVVVIRVLEGEELKREINGENGRQEKRRVDNLERQAKCDVVQDGLADDNDTSDNVTESEPIKEEKRVYGKVVYIMERKPDQAFAGTLGFDLPNGQSRERTLTRGQDRPPRILWFKPTDRRAPLIAIPVEDAPRDFLSDPAAFGNILFKATVRKWPAKEQYPLGAVTGTLGQMGEISIESAALLVDAGVVWDEFSDEVLACLPATPWKIPEHEYAKRRDFREERIFSIDPQTARDLDDAVSVKSMGDGTFEIGVHIADVAYFVRPGSALDVEARSRATTVYLVQKAIPMLPRLLCEELCSLNPGVERLAFSVVWRMDSSARILDKPWFGRTIIKSCAKLSYDHAQRLIEGQTWDGLPEVEISGNTTVEDIKADTLRLYEFSRMMRTRRFEGGALSMQNVKLWFGIDDFGNPISVGVYQIKDSNKLIEEFMLLANMAVAQKIAERFPNGAMLRNHRPPKTKGLNEFVEFAAKLGYVIDPESSSSLQKSFEAITDPEKRTVMRQLCIKPMQRAKYFSTGSLDINAWRHFALNVPLYTHFTSPIRRYCDLMVHRMLEAVCDGTPGDVYDPKEVAIVAKRCNDRKEGSKEAQEASQKLYLCAYLTKLCEKEAARHRESQEKTELKPGILVNAVVHNVGPRSFDVLIQDYGLEKRIWIEDAIEMGDAVGVETVPGVVPALRIHWKKRNSTNMVNGLAEDIERLQISEDCEGKSGEDATGAANEVTPRKPTDRSNKFPIKSATKRKFDAATVLTQTIRIFDQVMVRIVPEITRSPPDFKITPEHPDDCRATAAALSAKLDQETLHGDGVQVSCPAITEDAE